MLGSSPEMITAVLNFEINKKFSEWEQSFYGHQPIARAAGIFELYHGHEPNTERKGCVIVHALSEQHMQKFMEANSAAIAASGHILESTNIAIYVN